MLISRKKIQHLVLLAAITAPLCLLLLQCSEKTNLQKTSFLSEIPTPTILNIENLGSALTVTVNQLYDKNIHKEIDQIILLRDEKNGTFENLNAEALSFLDNVEEIPYVAAFADITLTSYTFKITLPMPHASFTVSEAHEIKVFSKGTNETYGRTYDNNGWLISPFSESKTIYLSEKKELTLNNFHQSPTPTTQNYGFSIAVAADGAVSINSSCDSLRPANVANSGCDVIFSIESNGGGLAPHLTGPCSTATANNKTFRPNQPGIYPVKANTMETLIKPTTQEASYLCTPVPIHQQTALIARGKAGGFAKILPKSNITNPGLQTSKLDFSFDIYLQPGNITDASAF